MYEKRIYFNKKLLFIILGIPLMVYLGYLIYEIIPTWEILTGPEEYNPEKNYSLRSQMLIFILEWNAINANTGILAFAFPIFIMLGLLNFKEDLTTYFVFGKNRFNHYYYTLIKTILKYSLMITLAFVIGHGLIFITFYWITPLTDDLSLDSTSYIFNQLLPANFFEGRPLFYFLSTVMINDVPIIFSYSLLFAVFTLFTKDNFYWFVSVPIAFVILGIFLSNSLGWKYTELSDPFLGYYSKITDTWKYTILPLALAGIGLLMYRNGEKKYDI